MNHYAYENDAPSLCETFSSYFRVGAAVNTWILDSDKNTEKENALIKHQFNVFTLENESKPVYVHPEKDRYDFSKFDRFVRFGQETGTKLRGHTLLWHGQCPDWFFYDDNGNEVSSEILIERLREHVTTIVSRYKGKISTWDVCNEVIKDDGSGMRESKWYKIGGKEVIKEAYRAAHKADPGARLILNDYGLENGDKKTDAIIAFVREMASEGVHIDGIGLQMHLNLFETDMDSLKKNVGRILTLRDDIPGFRLEVTELDMSCYRWNDKSEDIIWTDELEERFICQYSTLFRYFMELSEQDLLDTVVFWGIGDRYSWLNGFPRKHKNFPLLIDRDLKFKDAFYKIAELADRH